MTGIGSRLLEIRKSTGMNQADFGKLFGLSDRAYKNYELEIREVPIHVVIQICEKFGVTANWLVLGLGAMRADDLVDLLARAKKLARQRAEQSHRDYDEIKMNEMEAHFLQYLLDEGLPAEDRLKPLLGGL